MPTRKKKQTSRKSLTREARQKIFLDEYGTSLNVTMAAHAAGVDRGQHYIWLTEPGYADAFNAAQARGKEVLEAEIYRRAVTGVPEPVWYQGVQCGTVRRYSDILLMFHAKKCMPEYRDNWKAEIQHTGGVQVAATTIDLGKLNDEQYAELKQILGPALQAAPDTELGGTDSPGGSETGAEPD